MNADLAGADPGTSGQYASLNGRDPVWDTECLAVVIKRTRLRSRRGRARPEADGVQEMTWPRNGVMSTSFSGHNRLQSYTTGGE